MTENKRFKLHIEWYNKEKTDGEVILYEKGQPLGVIESIEDARLIRNVLNELYDENEELKKENYKLHKRLGDFEPFEEYIKERTSKTSVNNIIGLGRTDEPTNSVELKKELYK